MAAKRPTDLSEVVTTDEAIDDLARVMELAEMLGVTRSSIYRYIARNDFPAPVVALKRRRAWSRREVAEWAKRTLPLRDGRPPKVAPARLAKRSDAI
jgi:predicted DNA-binding transcriptional regulator AlpA